MVVAELEGFVCHVDFQTRDTLFAKGRKFGEDVWGWIGDKEMEGVVSIAFLIGFDMRLLQDGEESRIASALRCECYLPVSGSVVCH